MDLFNSIDDGNTILLVALHFQAAFDILNHQRLLDLCAMRCGMKGINLDWLESYLTGLTQSVLINNTICEPVSLTYGVPPGSISGPILFNKYLTPLGDLLRSRIVEI